MRCRSPCDADTDRHGSQVLTLFAQHHAKLMSPFTTVPSETCSLGLPETVPQSNFQPQSLLDARLFSRKIKFLFDNWQASKAFWKLGAIILTLYCIWYLQAVIDSAMPCMCQPWGFWDNSSDFLDDSNPTLVFPTFVPRVPSGRIPRDIELFLVSDSSRDIGSRRVVCI